MSCFVANYWYLTKDNFGAPEWVQDPRIQMIQNPRSTAGTFGTYMTNKIEIDVLCGNKDFEHRTLMGWMGHVPVLKKILKCKLTKTIYITYRICFPYLKIATNLNDDILCKESGQQAAFKKNPKSVPLPHPSTHFRSFFYLFWNLDKNTTQRQRQLQRQWQRKRRQENNWNNNSMLYFQNPDDSSVPNNVKQWAMTNIKKWQMTNNDKQQQMTNNNKR